MDIDLSTVVLGDDLVLPWSSSSDEPGLRPEPMEGMESLLSFDPPNAMDLELQDSPLTNQSMRHRVIDDKRAAANAMPPERRATRGCRFHYPPEVWDAHKEEIRQLYIEENLSLPKVMQLMAKRGLAGTEKMFKARFTEWGFVKNNRRRDITCMLKLRDQREAYGKKTVFTRNGRPVDIERYLRRARPLSSSTVPEPVGTLPQHLGARSPSPPPHHILPPEDLHFEETFLAHIHYLASQHYASWNYWECQIGDDTYHRSDITGGIETIYSGSILIGDGNIEVGSKILRLGFTFLPQIFISYTFYSFLDLLMVTEAIPDEFVSEVWRFLAAYSAVVLRGAHPLNNVLQQMHRLHNTEDIRFVRGRMKRLTIRLLNLLCKWSNSRDPVLLQIVSSGAGPGKFWSYGAEAATMVLNDISRARQDARKAFGPRSKKYFDVVWQQLAVTGCLVEWGSEASFELSTDILKEVEQLAVLDDHLRVICKGRLADYHWRKWSQSDTPAALDPRHELARHYLEEFIGFCEENFIPSNALDLIGRLSCLQSWQEEAGLTAEAWKTAKRLDATLSRISNLPEPETDEGLQLG